MLKKFFIFFTVCLIQTGFLFAQSAVTLENAIREVSRDFGSTMPNRSKVLVLHIKSPTEALQTHIIKTLTSELARNPSLSVVETQNRPSLTQYSLKLEEDLDNARAQTIGTAVGVQVVIIGAVTGLENSYTLQLRSISAQNGQTLLTKQYNLRTDATLTNLTKVAAAPISAPAAVPTPAPALPPAPAAASTQVYKIGDTGPAGGIIFYINSQAGDWKYLEAAPANTEKQTFWAAENFPSADIDDSRGVGTGKFNSTYIMRHATDRGGGFDWAAEVCDSLVVNGYDDWYLPSRDELHQVYGNLVRKGLGGFKSDWYWSSTANGKEGRFGWRENFTDGTQDSETGYPYNGSRDRKYRVRAIRQF
jgi:TolB-like protein